MVLAIVCFCAPLLGDALPNGYAPIGPCDGKETLTFWELLQSRGAVIGEKITLLKKNDETVPTTISHWNPFYDLVLSETGRMDPYRNHERVPGEGSYILYKGNLHNDGSVCYMLVCTGSGSGKYDHVYAVWKMIDDRMERLDMYADVATTFFPGNDAHLFYGQHATSFLIEKAGKVFMRWLGFEKCKPDGRPSGIYTYYWEGNTLQYVPALSQGKHPIVNPAKRVGVLK